MEDSHVSLKKAALLENAKYKTLSSKINKHPEKYILEQRPNPNGGKPLVYVALSSLSVQAQRLFKAQTQPPTSKANVPETDPWYLTTDFNWYNNGH